MSELKSFLAEKRRAAAITQAELAERIEAFRNEQTDTVLSNPDPREA